jgi:hypothetical protein
VKSFCVWILLCFAATNNGMGQVADSHSFTDDSTNQLFVRLSLPGNNDRWHASATIPIFARVSSLTPGKPGASLRVDFFSDTNFLGSSKAVWHQEIKPDPNSKNAQPRIIVAAGFFPAEFVWTNVPAGNYKLTAQVTGTGIVATSEPVDLAVVP